jgi:hypothetical protein
MQIESVLKQSVEENISVQEMERDTEEEKYSEELENF